jgi:hypothetical protein
MGYLIEINITNTAANKKNKNSNKAKQSIHGLGWGAQCPEHRENHRVKLGRPVAEEVGGGPRPVRPRLRRSLAPSNSGEKKCSTPHCPRKPRRRRPSVAHHPHSRSGNNGRSALHHTAHVSRGGTGQEIGEKTKKEMKQQRIRTGADFKKEMLSSFGCQF